MMIKSGGLCVVYLATLGCSGATVDDPRTDDTSQVASVAQALTAGGLDGLCLHVARNEGSPRYATRIVSTDVHVRARPPADLPDGAQIWCFDAVEGQSNTYRILDPEVGGYLDAFQSRATDYRVVLRSYQADSTQEWVVSGGPTWFRIRQASSQRYLDSYFGSQDDQFVTRAFQNNTTQEFALVEPDDAPPDPESCEMQYASVSSTHCELGTYCGYFTGYVSISCDETGGNQSQCTCWVSSESEPESMTLNGDSLVACDAALDACLAE
jgi:hypothetical protein